MICFSGSRLRSLDWESGIYDGVQIGRKQLWRGQSTKKEANREMHLRRVISLNAYILIKSAHIIPA